MIESHSVPSSPDLALDWCQPVEHVSLGTHKVDLWLTNISQPASVLSLLYKILSSEERAKANRQVTPELVNRFIVARGLLRVLVGRYLDEAPETIRFSKNRYGKPGLAEEFAGRCMFNKSHSRDLLLFGFAESRDIGVDLECIRENINLERLARRQFTPDEYETFVQCPCSDRLRFFFQTWTRKEAVGKAVGKGLIFQMGSIDVSGIPDNPVVFHRPELADSNPDNWYIRDIHDIPKDYCASVSTHGRIESLNQYLIDTKNLRL